MLLWWVDPLQCLIPEVPFKLYGETGMLAYLEKVVNEKGHAVVCVAEGAGQVRGACVLCLGASLTSLALDGEPTWVGAGP